MKRILLKFNHFLSIRLTWITVLILLIPIAIVSPKSLRQMLMGVIKESEKHFNE